MFDSNLLDKEYDEAFVAINSAEYDVEISSHEAGAPSLLASRCNRKVIPAGAGGSGTETTLGKRPDDLASVGTIFAENPRSNKTQVDFPKHRCPHCAYSMDSIAGPQITIGQRVDLISVVYGCERIPAGRFCGICTYSASGGGSVRTLS
ncbi:hypothetical protein BSLG_010749 [Batrachochytrium salamandrivorans]|nr:hypothetical protein BSLG_010749 [Batrachochytrium salamandrivorans]